jgi:hypothetical protein
MGLFVAQHSAGFWVVLAFLIAIGLMAVVWLVFMPRRWWASLSRAETRIVAVYLAIRLIMPLVFQFLSTGGSSLVSGGSDANVYHSKGVQIAQDLFQSGTASAGAKVPGTGSVNLAVGWFYFIIGAPVRIAGIYAWTLLGTIGVMLFWLATRQLAGKRKDTYALVLLFAPTLLIWNVTIGKDALIMFGLGCLVASVQMFLSRRNWGWATAYLVAGTLVVGSIRPFILGMCLFAFTVGIIVAKRNRLSLGTRVFVMLMLLGGVVYSYSQTSALLGTDASGTTVIESAYQSADRTAGGQGGSSYATAPTRSIAQVPNAVTTVLLRPYLWESRSILQLFASLESIAMAGLLAWSLWRVTFGRERFIREPAVVASAVYTLLFCSAIVSYGNFGLIVRQRMQVWPFLILLAFATADRTQPLPTQLVEAEPLRHPRTAQQRALGSTSSRAAG